MSAPPTPALSDAGVRERIFVLLEAERPDGDFNVRQITEKVLAYLRENEPELLGAFAELMMFQTLHNFYRRKMRDHRRAARRSVLEASFAAAVADVDLRGDWYAQAHAIDKANTMRRVADMTGKDHEFVAAGYQASGQRDLLLAAFHRRVARIVGTKRTADAIPEQDYERMFRAVVMDDGGDDE